MPYTIPEFPKRSNGRTQQNLDWDDLARIISNGDGSRSSASTVLVHTVDFQIDPESMRTEVYRQARLRGLSARSTKRFNEESGQWEVVAQFFEKGAR